MIHEMNMRIRKKRLQFAAVTLLLSAFWTPAEGQDAQWRGPERNGKYPDKGLLKEWPGEGPELVLKKEGLGMGYSTPVMYEGMIYIGGVGDSLDYLIKMDLQGNIIWRTAYGHVWKNTYPESRNTPTIEDGRIYIMGGMGSVACIDAGSGGILWSVNTHEKFEGEFHRWGMAESLLLTDNAVISAPVGGRTAVVALDKSDGSLLWETEPVGGVRSYASPTLINHNGREMILVVSSEDLVAVDPGNGEVIWTFDIVTGHAPRGSRNNTVTPIYHEGSVFVTSGYDVEAVMISLSEDGTEPTLKWSDGTLDVHHGGVVLVDGYIYGANWINNGMGNWVCQEWETGKVMYEEKWHNKGSIIYADNRLYVYEEKRGHLGLVEPTPEGFNVISSFRIEEGTGPHWAHLSVYDRKLLVRHGGVLLVYDIAE